MKYLLTLALVFSANYANSENDNQAVMDGLKKLAPTAKVTAIEKTPIKDIYQVTISGGRGSEIYYMSNNGEYLLTGKLFNTENGEDLTEVSKSKLRKLVLDKVDEGGRINFYPKEMKHKITVFTDIDCGYCRKLHNEIQEYNDLGIGVSYLFFPRSGLNTASFDKAVNVWCSADKLEAMTNAKAGMDLDTAKCDNPVGAQYQAGIDLGVTGTPAIVLDNGRIMPGYVPPATLIERLNMLSAK